MKTEREDPARKTIFIIDDHPVLRRGLAAVIDTEPDLALCGEAATRQEALAALRECRPDLVIVDLMLGQADGLDLIKEMKKRDPDIPILVLSMHDEGVYGERSLKAGARGYVCKAEMGETLLVAIRRLLDGETYMSDTLQARLAAKCIAGKTLPAESPVDALSDRQLQVFELIGNGRTTRQIAEALNLSIKTIESHREHIKNKLVILTTEELARRAARWVATGRSH